MSGRLCILLALAGLVGLACGSPVEPSAEELMRANDLGEDISQVALFGDDSSEVAKLTDEKRLFADYCLSTRDEVKVYLKEGIHDAAMKVFNVMFNSNDELQTELNEKDKATLSETAEFLKESGIGSEPVPPAKSSEEVEQRIEANVDKVKKASWWSSLTDLMRAMVNTVIETISSETAKRLAILRAQLKDEDVREHIERACSSISVQLKRQLENQLRDFTNEHRSLAANNPEMKELLDSTKIENVGCATTGRIVIMSRFCDILAAVGPILYPMIGI